MPMESRATIRRSGYGGTIMWHASSVHLHAAGRASSSPDTAFTSVSCGSVTWRLCNLAEHAAGHTPGEQLPIVRLRLTYKLPAV